MTKYSRLSRFGMMFKPLTESLGGELLMLYRADFHAKTSPQQEKEQALTESGQECGKRWQGLLARYDPNTHSLRTVQCSLFEDLNQSLQTWPRWGSMRNGECFQQPMWEQTTSESEFGLSQKVPNNIDFFHTPNTTGIDGGSNSRRALKKRMFPTPNSSDANGANMKLDKNGIPHDIQKGYLRGFVKQWPTPQSADGKNAIVRHRTKSAQIMLGGEIALQDSQLIGGHLNPMWVEWLMGWLLGWTDLKPLEMDKCHCVQQLLGTSLKED
jgi:DNA (cytosine-5)-methyltransferase 1